MPSDAEKTLSIQPTRSYQIPGGPYAKNLGETTVKVLAEVRREDDGAGR